MHNENVTQSIFDWQIRLVWKFTDPRPLEYDINKSVKHIMCSYISVTYNLIDITDHHTRCCDCDSDNVDGIIKPNIVERVGCVIL